MNGLMIARRALVVGLLVSPIRVRAAARDELERLIAANSAARGGVQRLRRLRTMDTVIRIIEPSYTVIGRYRADRDEQMRIDVFAEGKRGFSEGIDGAGAWAWPGGEPAPKPMGDKGRQALEHGIVFNLLPLFDLARRGHRLTLVAADPPCAQLDFADGFSARLFFDPLSGHIVRRQDRRAYHPDVDPTENRIETCFSDFRMTDGVVSPWVAEDHDLGSGQRIGRTETLRLAWDQPARPWLSRDAVVEPVAG
jgi:hypothetical protein